MRNFTLRNWLRGAKRADRPSTTFSPSLNDFSAKIAKQGVSQDGSNLVENLAHFSHLRHLRTIVQETEQKAVLLKPVLDESERQLTQDLPKEDTTIKDAQDKVKERLTEDLELTTRRIACLKSFKVAELAESKQRLEEISTDYKKVSDQYGFHQTGQPIGKNSGFVFALSGIAIWGVEAAANMQAFIKAYPEDLISTGAMALGTSLAVTMMGKLCGAALAGFRNKKSRSFVAIALIIVVFLSAATFSILVGGTRAYADPKVQPSSIWAALAAVTINVFLFLAMLAASWAHVAKKQIASVINPLVERLMQQQAKVESLNTEIAALDLQAIDAEAQLKRQARADHDNAARIVREKAETLAKNQGIYHGLLATMQRHAHVLNASLLEVIYGTRIHAVLASKQHAATSFKDPDVDLDPKVYYVPTSKPSTPPTSIHSNGKSHHEKAH